MKKKKGAAENLKNKTAIQKHREWRGGRDKIGRASCRERV